MKKNKIITIVLSCLALCCGIAYLVAYLVVPQETIGFSMGLKDFFLQPLPIIGVSLAVICLFIWKLFRSSSFGKKQIQKLWDLIGQIKADADVQKANYENALNSLKQELEKAQEYAKELKSYIDAVAKTIPNKKVNKLADQFDEKENNNGGEKTKDIETTKE